MVFELAKWRPKEIWTRRFEQPLATDLKQDFKQKFKFVMDMLPETTFQNKSNAQAEFDHRLVFRNNHMDPNAKVIVASCLKKLEHYGRKVDHFRSVGPFHQPLNFSLSESTQRDLEIFQTNRSLSTESALISTIDATCSPLGRRNLVQSVLEPYTCHKKIRGLHDLVEKFLTLDRVELNLAKDQLSRMPDLLKLANRLKNLRSSPQELLKIQTAINCLAEMAKILKQAGATEDKLSKNIAQLLPLEAKIGNTISIDSARNSCVFKEGFHEQIDQLVDSHENGQQHIDQYLKSLQKQLEIPNLKVKPHKTYGLLFEISKKNLAKVPEFFTRRQTMTNAERFSCVKLAELHTKMTQSQEALGDLQQKMFQDFLADIQCYFNDMVDGSQQFGELDKLFGFALLAAQNNYVRPVVFSLNSIERKLILKNSRHPVIESIIGPQNFIPNEVDLSQPKSIVLITGPNMAGKSTIMRQIALSALMNQIGCFVPATYAEIPIFDGIFTRIGASDDISSGLSTFMVEMTEAAHIIKKSTSKSLIILDELGRGTSTEDGLAISAAVLNELANTTKAFCLFATHLHELVHHAHTLSNVTNMQTEVIDDKNKLQFTRKLIPGAASSSYGVEVAKLAGMPIRIIKDANRFLGKMTEPQHSLKNTMARPKIQEQTKGLRQEVHGNALASKSPMKSAARDTAYFTPNKRDQQILDKIKSIVVHKTTPMQAINIINDLQQIAHQAHQPSLGLEDQELLF